MGRYNDWSRDDDNFRPRRGRGGGFRGIDERKGRGGFRGRAEFGRGFRGGRGGRDEFRSKPGDNEDFRGGYRGRERFGREDSLGSRFGRDNRDDHGSRFGRSDREGGYGNRFGSSGGDAPPWKLRDERSHLLDSLDSASRENVAMGILKAVLHTVGSVGGGGGGDDGDNSSRSFGRGRYSGREEYSERFSGQRGNYRNRETFNREKSWQSEDSYRPKRVAMSAARREAEIEDPTVDEEIDPKGLKCFICDWMNFDSKEEYLEHLRGKDHYLRTKRYHDVNDSLLEILRGDAKISSLREIQINGWVSNFVDCDRCQCVIHESMKRTHSDGAAHQQVKKLLNMDCCDKLNLYMDRRGWHQLTHHLLSIGHLKNKFEDEEKKINGNEDKPSEEQQKNAGVTAADEKPATGLETANSEAEKQTNIQEVAEDEDIAECKEITEEKKSADVDKENDGDGGTKISPTPVEHPPTTSSGEKQSPGEGTLSGDSQTDCMDQSMSVDYKEDEDWDEPPQDYMEKIFKITGNTLKVFNPVKTFGAEYVKDQARFYCRSCKQSFLPNKQILDDHCSSKNHHCSLVALLKESRELEEKNETASHEDDGESINDLFENLDNLETVDEVIDDDDDDDEQLEQDGEDHSSVKKEDTEKMDTSPCEVKDVSVDMEEMFEEAGVNALEEIGEKID